MVVMKCSVEKPKYSFIIQRQKWQVHSKQKTKQWLEQKSLSLKVSSTPKTSNMTVKRTITRRNIQTPDGFLMKASTVKILEFTETNVKVSDMTGRIFWLEENDLVL
jgi:hypothetical protein